MNDFCSVYGLMYGYRVISVAFSFGIFAEVPCHKEMNVE